MEHDVFISYSSKEKSVADGVCHYLEDNGVKCWMAPRDIPVGTDYAALINDAIKSCRAVVLVFSRFSAVSRWVYSEINIAFSAGKPIVPLRIDESMLEGGMELMLNQMHWIDAYPSYADRLPDLLRSILGFISVSNDNEKGAACSRKMNDGDLTTTRRMNDGDYIAKGYTILGIGKTKVTRDDVYAMGNGVRYVKISDSVTTIAKGAFGWCENLAQVVIPDTVSDIYTDAFYLVKNIVYHGKATGQPWYALTVNGYVEGGYVYRDSNKQVLTGYIGTESVLSIPETVICIAEHAFSSCINLKEVIIPNTVNTISQYAFSSCRSLVSLKIPDSVVSIGRNAFEGCAALMSIVIPDSVNDIGQSAFEGCLSLKEAIIPNSITTIEWGVFKNCKSLKYIAIPSSVTTIFNGAFSGCVGLRSVEVPESVSTINVAAFAGCRSLTSILIPESVSFIDERAFEGCVNLKMAMLLNADTVYQDDSFPEHTEIIKG